jgi:uroporphyrinogen-III decarboxylase
MNHVERFRAVMNFQPPDRLPVWEWAMWWDETIARWKTEGLPSHLNGVFDISQYLGLDPYIQFWMSTTETTIEAKQHHVEGVVSNMDDYLSILPRLYPAHDQAIEAMRLWTAKQARGEAVVWASFEGFFWFARTLMGFEKLMYAYFDQPELIHRISQDLLNFHVRTLRKMADACVPTFVTLAEDMSYNHGPMISRGVFDEFLAPYYRQFLPMLEELHIVPILDSDGDVTLMTPWWQEVGMGGILPLERQAKVDGNVLRKKFPTLRMIGHFDKLVMNRGEASIRAEFERLRPLIKSGGFIPSVDHQTPPGVSLQQYRNYLHIFRESVT